MRVLILSSSTGGGHNMRGRSFIEWSQLERPRRFDVRLHKALENTNEFLAFGVRAYNWIQRTYPALHNVYFSFLEVAAPCNHPAKIFGKDRFRAVLDEHPPDLILSVHGFTNHAFFEIARQHLNGQVRCVTYCGELFGRFGFSRHWVNPEADLFIGAVEETRARALELGMPAERAVVGGFLLHPAFYATPLTPGQRAQFLEHNLKLDPHKFTLLLSTGEHGANNHLPFLESLRSGLSAEARRQLQVIALCGRKPETFDEVRRWAEARADFTVRPLPFADAFHMSRLLQCASAVVVRPGTGSTSEAIQTGCPIIFNGLGGFMPQEKITLRYAARRGFAQRVNGASELPGLIQHWLLDRDHPQYNRLRELVAGSRPEQHPIDILDYVHSVPARAAGRLPAPKSPLPALASSDTEAALG